MTKKIPTFITQEEFEKILEAENDKEYKLAFLLGFEAGLRISEIVGLKTGADWKIAPLNKAQIDLSANTLKVVGGKGGKDRMVPLPKRFTKKVYDLLPIKKSRRALEWKIHKLGLNVLNKNIHFHSLRHSFGSYLAGKDMPLDRIQVLMGHSRLDTTGIYLHANPKKAMDQARELF